MANPPDPRNGSANIMPRFSSRGPATEEARTLPKPLTSSFNADFIAFQETQKANDVLETMNRAYGHVLSKANGNPTMLQAPKIGGKATGMSKKPAQLFVHVQSLHS